MEIWNQLTSLDMLSATHATCVVYGWFKVVWAWQMLTEITISIATICCILWSAYFFTMLSVENLPVSRLLQSTPVKKCYYQKLSTTHSRQQFWAMFYFDLIFIHGYSSFEEQLTKMRSK